MGGPYNPGCPKAKGPVPYCLEEISKATSARARLETLQRDIKALAPTYRGLAAVFETDLLTHFYEDPKAREIRLHLERHWFDAPDATAYFRGAAVAEIYAKGVLEALEKSLSGSGTPLKIEAWWHVGHEKVAMVTAPSTNGLRLEILTPRPVGAAGTGAPPILGFSAAWVTEDVGGTVTTTRFEGDPQAPTLRRP
jgi:hypothetical protein